MRDPYRWRAPAAAWAALILLATLVPVALGPGGESPSEVGRWCLICGDRGLADGLLNVLLFAPLGWWLARGRGLLAAVLAGFALSLGVELMQGGIAGRYSTLGDVVFNTAGAALGALAARHTRWLVPALALGSLAGLLTPPLLLAPAPTRGVYYGQWTAEFGNLERYEGRVLSAELGGVPLPDGPSRRSPELQRAFGQRGPLAVVFEAGPVTEGLAPVFSVYDDEQVEILLLGVDGDDLVYIWRSRSAVLRLDRPYLVFPGALEGVSPGDTVRAAVAQGSTMAPCMSLNRRTKCDVAPGFAAGWTLLLYPLPLSGAIWRVLADLVWAGALAAPLGWLLRRPPVALGGALTLASLLLLVSRVSPDLVVTPLPALALVAGAGLGAAARGWVA